VGVENIYVLCVTKTCKIWAPEAAEHAATAALLPVDHAKKSQKAVGVN